MLKHGSFKYIAELRLSECSFRNMSSWVPGAELKSSERGGSDFRRLVQRPAGLTGLMGFGFKPGLD